MTQTRHMVNNLVQTSRASKVDDDAFDRLAVAMRDRIVVGRVSMRTVERSVHAQLIVRASAGCSVNCIGAEIRNIEIAGAFVAEFVDKLDVASFLRIDHADAVDICRRAKLDDNVAASSAIVGIFSVAVFRNDQALSERFAIATRTLRAAAVTPTFADRRRDCRVALWARLVWRTEREIVATDRASVKDHRWVREVAGSARLDVETKRRECRRQLGTSQSFRKDRIVKVEHVKAVVSLIA